MQVLGHSGSRGCRTGMQCGMVVADHGRLGGTGEGWTPKSCTPNVADMALGPTGCVHPPLARMGVHGFG